MVWRVGFAHKNLCLAADNILQWLAAAAAAAVAAVATEKQVLLDPQQCVEAVEVVVVEYSLHIHMA